MRISAPQHYRTIKTRRGKYFVPWHVDAVARLFIDEKLTPADLLSQQTTEIHQLIRDLYLLACAGALGGALNHNSNTTLLAQYARTLRGLMQTRH